MALGLFDPGKPQPTLRFLPSYAALPSHASRSPCCSPPFPCRPKRVPPFPSPAGWSPGHPSPAGDGDRAATSLPRRRPCSPSPISDGDRAATLLPHRSLCCPSPPTREETCDKLIMRCLARPWRT